MATLNSLLALCLFSSAFVTVTDEQRSSKLLSRLVRLPKRSSHAPRETYPWHVFINTSKCSGVFVRERWVLTSAFCVHAVKTQLSSPGLVPFQGPFASDRRTTVFVRVGNHNLALETPGVDSVPVMKAFVYPKYNPNASSGNLGLLYLARDVMLPNDQHVQRIKLPHLKFENSIRRATNRSAKVTGWGHRSSAHKTPFRTLHENDVSLAPVCLQSFMDGGNRREMLDESWCVVAGTHGMCSIDQGSPLIIQRNRSWVVLGVYSRGETCVSGKHAALFSRINSETLEWMQKLFTAGGER